MTPEQTPFPTSATATSPDNPSATRSADVAGAMSGTTSGTTETRSGELLDKVVRSAHQSLDRLAETAAPHLGQLEHSLSGAAEALHSRGEHWRETGDAWAEELRSTVREHPLAAVGVALAVGMLLARLSDR
jgi:ElaB/YqjD/DUF883 family membrane-anchored ribosome-binding protein